MSLQKRHVAIVVVPVAGAALIASILLLNKPGIDTSAPAKDNGVDKLASSVAAPPTKAKEREVPASATETKATQDGKVSNESIAPTIPPPRNREELVRRVAEQLDNKSITDMLASAQTVAARADGTHPITSPSIAHRIVLPRSALSQEITLRFEYPDMQTGERAPLVRVAGTSGSFTAKSSTTDNALLVYMPADRALPGNYIMDINFIDRAREGQHRYILNLAATKN